MDYSKIDEYNYCEIIDYLKNIADEKYKIFNSGIVKDTESEILGVRLPELRKIAKDILKGDYEGFLHNSGKTYYEEVMLRGLIAAQVKALRTSKSVLTSLCRGLTTGRSMILFAVRSRLLRNFTVSFLNISVHILTVKILGRFVWG